MLTDFQREKLWEFLIATETRADYFAALSQRYQNRDRWLIFGGLMFSSSAAAAFLAGLPERLAWVKAALALIATILNALSLVARNERSAIECSDLHFRLNTLAFDAEQLWNNTYADDAASCWEGLRRRGAEISKTSTSMPDDARLMAKMQDNVLMHHKRELVA